MNRCIGLCLGALWVMCLQGCDRPGCDGRAYAPKADSPVISKMDLLRQLDDDPWTVLFAVEFQAPAADLASGDALVYLNGDTTPATVKLRNPLQESEVDSNQTAGRFAMHLRFTDTVQDGDTVRMATQLRTGAGRRSNCYELDLLFNVRPVSPTALLQKSIRWSQHVFDEGVALLLKPPT